MTSRRSDRNTVAVDGIEQRVEALPSDRNGAQQRWHPVRVHLGRHRMAELEHPAQLGLELPCARLIRLVDDEDIGDLQDAGLRRLHTITEAGCEDDERGVGHRCDVDLRLPDPDRLEDHVIEARGVRDERRGGDRSGEPAEMSPGRHRTDEHPVIAVMGLHPDAIPEERTTGERRGRIHREDRDPSAAGAQLGDECGGDARLPHPRRPRDADEAGAAGERMERSDHLPLHVRWSVLDEREDARERATVTRRDPLDQCWDVVQRPVLSPL